MAKSVALPMMMDMIREDLAALSVVHDFFRSEQALHDDASVDGLEELTSKELIYQGVLEPPKAKNRRDWEPSPQTLFKSTEFGDDSDHALKKSTAIGRILRPILHTILTNISAAIRK